MSQNEKFNVVKTIKKSIINFNTTIKPIKSNKK